MKDGFVTSCPWKAIKSKRKDRGEDERERRGKKHRKEKKS